MNSTILQYRDADQLHECIEGGVVPSSLQVVKERNKAINNIFEHFGVEMGTSFTQDMQSVLRHKFWEFKQQLPEIWQYRLTTCTFHLTHKSGMYFGELNEFMHKDENFDYQKISDGGVKVSHELQEYLVTNPDTRFLNRNEYLSSGGGHFTPVQLYNHPVVCMLIPDEIERKKYMLSLSILNEYGITNYGFNAIWVPREMLGGYGRLDGLGTGGETFYAPNLTTKGYSVLINFLPEKKRDESDDIRSDCM